MNYYDNLYRERNKLMVIITSVASVGAIVMIFSTDQSLIYRVVVTSLVIFTSLLLGVLTYTKGIKPTVPMYVSTICFSILMFIANYLQSNIGQLFYLFLPITTTALFQNQKNTILAILLNASTFSYFFFTKKDDLFLTFIH